MPKLKPFQIVIDPNDGTDAIISLYRALLNKPDITRAFIHEDRCQIWFRDNESAFPMKREEIYWDSRQKRSFNPHKDRLIDYRFDECVEAWIVDTQKGKNIQKFALIFNPYRNIFLGSREAIRTGAVEPALLTQPSEADRETKLDLFDINRYNRNGETFMVARGIHPEDVDIYWDWYLAFTSSLPH